MSSVYLLESRSVGANTSLPKLILKGLQFGGVKATGVGMREMGTEGVEFFTEVKTVYIDYTGTKRETNIY